MSKKSETIKKRTGKNHYIGKFVHVFNKKWTDEHIEALADEMYDWFTLQDSEGRYNIWLKDFAIQKGIGNQRISEFEKSNEYFKQVYSICKDIQESKLFKIGLKGNSAMPIFALKNISGWKDKIEDEKEDLENEDLQFEGWK